MEILTIVLIAWAIYSAYLIWKLYDRLNEQQGEIKSVAENVVKNEKSADEKAAAAQSQIYELTEKFELCSELIEATKEYTQEAANRERQMSEGISSILNYDAFSALAKGDK